MVLVVTKFHESHLFTLQGGLKCWHVEWFWYFLELSPRSFAFHSGLSEVPSSANSMVPAGDERSISQLRNILMPPRLMQLVSQVSVAKLQLQIAARNSWVIAEDPACSGSVAQWPISSNLMPTLHPWPPIAADCVPSPTSGGNALIVSHTVR